MRLGVGLLWRVMAIRADPSRGHAGAGNAPPPLLPGFAVAFAALVILNSFDIIPRAAATFGSDVSRWCLVAAVAALGAKTRLRELASVGLKPVLLMIGETVFLAVLVLLALRWF
jgi:uncharacterized membrane protein YadS